jgi:hypothetical protein
VVLDAPHPAHPHPLRVAPVELGGDERGDVDVVDQQASVHARHRQAVDPAPGDADLAQVGVAEHRAAEVGPGEPRPAEGVGAVVLGGHRQAPGISRRISSSQMRADMSEGARQSPRGDSEPPAETFGPFGSAERLNWLKEK